MTIWSSAQKGSHVYNLIFKIYPEDHRNYVYINFNSTRLIFGYNDHISLDYVYKSQLKKYYKGNKL